MANDQESKEEANDQEPKSDLYCACCDEAPTLDECHNRNDPGDVGQRMHYNDDGELCGPVLIVGELYKKGVSSPSRRRRQG